MKILLVFIDMIRVDFLNIYNPSANCSLLDKRLKRIGGIVYTNCFTPGPDTPRSMACMQTGLNPYYNGCDTRIKWPKYFVKDGISSIWDHAIEKGMKINLCCNKNETITGFFKYQEHENIKLFYNPSDFISYGNFEENSLSFIGIPDMHTAVTDYYSSNYAFKKGDKIVNYFFERYISDAFISQFDYTIIFSDHGFQLASERINMSSSLELLDDSRTKLLMFLHKSDSKNIIPDSRLASMIDLYATIEHLIGRNEYRQGFSFLMKPQRLITHVEDHKDFRVYPEIMIKQWRVISKSFDFKSDASENILVEGSEEDIKSATDYLENNSPKYCEYVKQLQVWSYYATLKSEESSLYFAGLSRIHPIAHVLLKYIYKIKSVILRSL